MKSEAAQHKELSKKTKLNFAVDLTTLLLILSMIGTGIVIRYILPPGSGGHGGGERWVLWGLDRHGWGGLHFWLAVGLVVIMLVHVALHWKWVCGITRRLIGRLRGGGVLFERRVAYGAAFIALMVLMLGGFVYVCVSSVEVVLGDVGDHGRHSLSPEGMQAAPTQTNSATRRSSHAGGVVVRGSMTLREVARGSSMTVNRLKELLGLPPSVSAGERLGHLKRRFGFEIGDVRRVVAKNSGYERVLDQQGP